MEQIKLTNFGRFGVVHDTLNQSLPVGVWSDSRNMRFTGNHVEKMLEPVVSIPFDSDTYGPAQWMQAWSDGLSVQIVVATSTQLWLYQAAAEGVVGSWVNATRVNGVYNVEGVWDSFPWGDTCIFNNGIDVPQIFDPGSQRFVDLPNWGLVSTADDISNNAAPSRDVVASTKILLPYKNFLIACGISEGGTFQPNTIWWSDSTTLATFSTGIDGGGPPNWDYESPASLSNKAEVGIGDGAITCAKPLNENIIVYTERSATAVQFAGGRLVFSIRRLFGKGAAGQQCAVEFNNQHYVLARDQIYIHDGSAVKLVAKDRVEEEFFRRVGKGGRFGGGDVDWNEIQVVKNPDRKEIYILFGGAEGTPACPDFPNAGLTIDATLLYEASGGDVAEVQGHQGYFHVEGQLIMGHGTGDNLIYSDDLGQTWTETATFPQREGDETGKIEFSSGYWYVVREKNRSDGAYSWSNDAGQTWTAEGSAIQNVTSCLTVNNGVVYGGDRTPGRVMRWTGLNINNGDWWRNDNWLGLNFDNLEVLGEYIVTKHEELGNAVYQIGANADNQTAFESATVTKYTPSNGGGSKDDHMMWSKPYKGQYVIGIQKPDSGIDLVYKDFRVAEGFIIDPVDMIAAGTTADLPTIEVDMEEPIDYPRFQTSPNYFICIARPYRADTEGKTNRLVLKWGTDAKNPDMSPLITININGTIDTSSGTLGRFYVMWAEDHKWVIAYQDATTNRVKYELFNLCVEST